MLQISLRAKRKEEKKEEKTVIVQTSCAEDSSVFISHAPQKLHILENNRAGGKLKATLVIDSFALDFGILEIDRAKLVPFVQAELRSWFDNKNSRGRNGEPVTIPVIQGQFAMPYHKSFQTIPIST